MNPEYHLRSLSRDYWKDIAAFRAPVAFSYNGGTPAWRIPIVQGGRRIREINGKNKQGRYRLLDAPGTRF